SVAVKIKTSKSEKIETQMAPMIDVVFQLLIFFMLTLKIVEPEGDFSINMPIGAPSEPTNELPLPDLKVRMLSDGNGGLADLRFGNRSLGTAPQCFDRLTNEIIKVTGTPGEVPNEQQVEIDADYNLRYEYGIACIGACTGKIQDGKMIRYIEKIKFSQVREPNSGEAGQ
ncbi:MAG: ExbD/TolR family protein, partial [Planctomycetaceae bacterium]